MENTFAISTPPGVWTDLRRRLAATRWSDAVTQDWSYGTDRDFLRKLVAYWATEYDWPERERALNRLPHRRAAIDGFGVHYLHFESPVGGSKPLLLMNGWPSSFVEYQKLAPLLTTASSGGPQHPTFDVVIPSLPGFGFGDHPARPYQVDAVDLFAKLMASLGYARFSAVGTDIGAGVATRLGLRRPEMVDAIHISAVADPPGPIDPDTLSDAERQYLANGEKWDREEGGYQSIQSTRPQTLAFALADSPAGMASWIVEKFRSWSDCGGELLSVFPLDTLIDNLMIYWLSETIGSSVRYYYDSRHFRPPLSSGDRVAVPTAIAVWPHDLARPPRAWAERLYNVRRYTVFERGGHFPAWEAPNEYAADLRTFFGSVG